MFSSFLIINIQDKLSENVSFFLYVVHAELAWFGLLVIPMVAVILLFKYNRNKKRIPKPGK